MMESESLQRIARKYRPSEVGGLPQKWSLWSFLYDLGQVLRHSKLLVWEVRPLVTLFLCLGSQAAAAYLNYWTQFSTAQIIGAVLDKNYSFATSQTFRAIGAYAGLAAVQMFCAFLGEHLTLRIRTGLVQKCHNDFFRSSVPYKISTLKSMKLSSKRSIGEVSEKPEKIPLNNVDSADTPTIEAQLIDNPDQRLTSDMMNLSVQIGALLFGNYSNPSSALGSIWSFIITLVLVTTEITPFALPFCFAFAIFSGFLTQWFSSMVSYNYYLVDRSLGVLRHFHARFSVYFEEITFFRGHSAEFKCARDVLTNYHKSYLPYIFWSWLLDTWNSFQYQYPYMLCYLVVVAILRFEGDTALNQDDDTSGTSAMSISTAVSIIGQFIAALCTFPQIWGSITEMSGYVRRVSEIMEVSEAVTPACDDLASSGGDEPEASLVFDFSTQNHSVIVLEEGKRAEACGSHTPLLADSLGLSLQPKCLSISIYARLPSSDSAARHPIFPEFARTSLEHHLDRFSLTLRRGELIALQGPSGLGKTTAVRRMAQLVKDHPDQFVRLHGLSAVNRRPAAEMSNEFQFSFQAIDALRALPGAGAQLPLAFTPQRPYIAPGSILDALTPPSASAAIASTLLEKKGPAQMEACSALTPCPVHPPRAGGGLEDALVLADVEPSMAALIRRRAREFVGGSGFLARLRRRFLLDPSYSSKLLCTCREREALLLPPGKTTSAFLSNTERAAVLNEVVESSGVTQHRRAAAAEALVNVGLGYVAERYGLLPSSAVASESHTPSTSSTNPAVDLRPRNWLQVLSAGEQQKFMVAQVLLKQPLFLVMDEGTSAMDPQSERRCLAALRAAGIAVLSVGHRDSLVPLCDRLFYVDATATSPPSPVASYLDTRTHTGSGSEKRYGVTDKLVDHTFRTEELGTSTPVMSAESSSSDNVSLLEQLLAEHRVPATEVNFPPLAPTLNGKSVTSSSKDTRADFKQVEKKNKDSLFFLSDKVFWRRLALIIKIGAPRLNRLLGCSRDSFLHSRPSFLHYSNDVVVSLLLVVALTMCAVLATISTEIAFFPGKIFGFLWDLDLDNAALWAGWGSLVYLASAVFGALSRAVGSSLTVAWFCRLIEYMDTWYLSPVAQDATLVASSAASSSPSKDGSTLEQAVYSLRWTNPTLNRLHAHRGATPPAHPTPTNAAFSNLEGRQSSLSSEGPLLGSPASLSPHASDGASSDKDESGAFRGFIAARHLDRLDQRIVSETNDLTSSLGQIVFGGNGFLSFIQILATVTALTIRTSKYGVWATLSCYLYAMFGILCTYLLSLGVPRAVALSNLLEGLLRSTHTRHRSFAEEAALLRGEGGERSRADAIYAAVLPAQAAAILARLPNKSFVNVFMYMGTALSYAFSCLIAVRVGHFGPFPADATNLYAVTYLLMSLLLNIASVPMYLSRFRDTVGHVHRVGALLEQLHSVKHRTMREFRHPSLSTTTSSSIPSTQTDGLDAVDSVVQDENPINYYRDALFMDIGPCAAAAVRLRPSNSATAADLATATAGALQRQRHHPVSDELVSIEHLYSAEDTQDPLHTPVRLTVARGEIVLVRGPSGCGKTSFLRALAGMIPIIESAPSSSPTTPEEVHPGVHQEEEKSVTTHTQEPSGALRVILRSRGGPLVVRRVEADVNVRSGALRKRYPDQKLQFELVRTTSSSSADESGPHSRVELSEAGNSVNIARVLALLARLEAPLPLQSAPQQRPPMAPAVFFIPQRAYICHGSLADNVLYPLRGPSAPSQYPSFCSHSLFFTGLPLPRALLRSAEGTATLNRHDWALWEPFLLRALALAGLLQPMKCALGPDFLHVQAPLEAILSGGEKQRLMFARALLCRPAFVIVDEGVSSLPAPAAATLLANLTLQGSGVVLVSHV